MPGWVEAEAEACALHRCVSLRIMFDFLLGTDTGGQYQLPRKFLCEFWTIVPVTSLGFIFMFMPVTKCLLVSWVSVIAQGNYKVMKDKAITYVID